MGSMGFRCTVVSTLMTRYRQGGSPSHTRARADSTSAFSEGIVAIFPDSAIVTIFDDDAGAPAPRHFAAYWPTQTSITLSWFTVETAAEYKLEFRKHGESDWIRISGDFDHLPSTSDHRDAFGVAAGLDCET